MARGTSPCLLALLALLEAASSACAALSLSGCSGERAPTGLSEPFRVRGAQFVEGPLPGTPPVSDEAADAGARASGTRVTFLETPNRVVTPAEQGKKLGGRASTDAFAVALRLADLGTGYWVLPVSGPDPQNGGELTFSLSADFSSDLPAGLHRLRLAAVDEAGSAGTQEELELCFVPPYPDNLAACDQSIEPPAAVVTLSWDTDADLDLRLLTPQGKLVEPKAPSTGLLGDAGVPSSTLSSRETGQLDRDSNGGCVLDGQRRESIVWQASPKKGLYQIYANLFDACGQRSARFTVQLLLAEADASGRRRLVEKLRKKGELTEGAASGGSSIGTFVAEFVID